MVKNKAYKFRLYPNQEQQIMFAKTFGCARFVYNKMLSEKIAYYGLTKKTLNITPAKYKDEFPFLKEVDSLALANAQLNLDKAYKNFFRDKSVGFPKYKSKHKSRQRYTTNNQNGSVRIENNKIKLPKIGFVKIKIHRNIPENSIIKSATVEKTPTDKYYVSVLVEYEETENIIDKSKAVGLDYSMTNFYVDSNGNKANYPKFYRNVQEKLAREQRKLSKMKLHSNNWYKQKKIVNKIHEKISNQRKDFLHKLSRQIANVCDIVCVEDLNMKNMSQYLNFGKSVMDNGWGMFIEFLSYKVKKLIKIDKWFPSSKTCHVCGYKNDNLTLSDRDWTCPDCGTHHDRDINASINILNQGLLLV